MPGMNKFVCIFILLLSVTLVAQEKTPDFQKLYENAQKGSLEITEEDKEISQRYVWIFVTGFLNEGAGWMGRYFGDNRDRLKEYVPGEEVYILRPSSSNSVEENAGILLKQSQEIYERHHKKLIMMANSKGGPEVLKMLYHEPQKTSQMIAAVLTIQAAFGSEIADFFMGDPSRAEEKNSLVNFFPFGEEGLKSLTTYESDRIFSKEVIDALARHPVPIYFLRTSQKVGMSIGIGWGAKYLDTFGDNDGMVTVQRQKLLNVGTDLGIIDADHADTVLESPSSNTPSSFRYHLTDAIFAYLMRRAD